MSCPRCFLVVIGTDLRRAPWRTVAALCALPALMGRADWSGFRGSSTALLRWGGQPAPETKGRGATYFGEPGETLGNWHCAGRHWQPSRPFLRSLTAISSLLLQASQGGSPRAAPILLRQQPVLLWTRPSCINFITLHHTCITLRLLITDRGAVYMSL